MKIGIEVQRLFRKKKHGMDIVALELIRNLQRLDHENEYFIFVKDDVDDTVIRETANFHIIRIKGGPYPYWEQVLLPAALKKHPVDLLHCTSNTAPLNPGVPMIITLHDIIYLEQTNLTKGSWYQIIGNLYRRWNVPKVVNKAKRLITVSEFENRNINNYFRFPDEKVVTVHNAAGKQFRRITDTTVLQNIRQKYNLPDDYVFYLGNTDPRKNLVGVMKALSILKKRGQLSFRLQMLDMDRAYLRSVAESVGDVSLLDDIAFCGYVPEEDLPAIYSLAKLFLYPSVREGFGIPILEAMQCEVPVITSTTSSMPEVAGDAAVLIDPTRAEALADAIENTLRDEPGRTRLIQDGLIRATAFSWEKSAMQVRALYKEVLKNG